jgi:hypothetical protein
MWLRMAYLYRLSERGVNNWGLQRWETSAPASLINGYVRLRIIDNIVVWVLVCGGNAKTTTWSLCWDLTQRYSQLTEQMFYTNGNVCTSFHCLQMSQRWYPIEINNCALSLGTAVAGTQPAYRLRHITQGLGNTQFCSDQKKNCRLHTSPMPIALENYTQASMLLQQRFVSRRFHAVGICRRLELPIDTNDSEVPAVFTARVTIILGLSQRWRQQASPKC